MVYFILLFRDLEGYINTSHIDLPSYEQSVLPHIGKYDSERKKIQMDTRGEKRI
jgi:hypothetical protein